MYVVFIYFTYNEYMFNVFIKKLDNLYLHLYTSITNIYFKNMRHTRNNMYILFVITS